MCGAEAASHSDDAVSRSLSRLASAEIARKRSTESTCDRCCTGATLVGAPCSARLYEFAVRVLANEIALLRNFENTRFSGEYWLMRSGSVRERSRETSSRGRTDAQYYASILRRA